MSLTPDTGELPRLSELCSGFTLQQAVPVLTRLVRERAFWESSILPFTKQAARARDWYLAYSYAGENGSYSLQIFVWPPGSKTQIHDHSSCGAFCCVVGCLLEERYERLDQGCQPGRARLRKVWQRVWERGEGISTLLPLEGGIHRVGNPSEHKAISVHLYGPRFGEVDGRDYDPSRDYVCDRREN